MFYFYIDGHLIAGSRVTNSDGDWTEDDKSSPPPGWTWHATEQEALEYYGLPLGLDILMIEENIEAVASMIGAEKLLASYAEAIAVAVPFEPVPHFGHGPGVIVIWDGEEYRNVSGTWLHSSPTDYPLGWSQITGLPDEVAPWIVGEAVIIGDLRSFDGITYRCITEHTTQAGWEPPIVPALWVPTG